LILNSGLAVDRCARVIVFSVRDQELVRLAGDSPGGIPVEIGLLNCRAGAVSRKVRKQIEALLRGLTTEEPDFDARR
jgi:hypothetical protein